MDKYNDEDILNLLNTDSELAMEILFSRYYVYLCKAVYRILHEAPACEDIVQEVFSEVWKKRKSLHIKSSLKGYLRRAAINKTLNEIRKRKYIFDESDEHEQLISSTHSSQKMIEGEELQLKINKAIEKLPKRCKLVFSMSRFEELSYKEIADTLDISVKTVENQISKALKIMREELRDYL